MNGWLRKALWIGRALVVLMAVAEVSEAQRGAGDVGPGRAAGRGFGVVSVRLASLDAVQQALELSDEQKQKVAAINERLQADRRGLFEQGIGDWREFRRNMEKLHEDATAELAALLDEPQQKRLAGISIQVNEGAALIDPLVAQVLQLSEEQKSKLREVGESIRHVMRDEFRQWREANLATEEFRRKFDKSRAEASKRLTAVLTLQQQEQFAALRGEPVEVELYQLGREGAGREEERAERGSDR